MMFNKSLTISIILGLGLAGCITQHPVKQNYLRPASRHIPAAEFAIQTEILKNDLSQTNELALQVDLNLQLAWLYVDTNNPQRDYTKALSYFETYTRLDEKNAIPPEIRNWLAVLKHNGGVERLNTDCKAKLLGAREKEKLATALQSQIDELQRKLTAARQQNKKIAEHNQELKKTIEKLKFLDLKLEKKRKSYR